MAKLIVVYRLKPGVSAAAFEAWASGVPADAGAGLRRLEAFTTTQDNAEATDYVEVYHIPDASSFDAADMPAHVHACIMGDYGGVDGQPQIRLSEDPN